MCLEGINIGLAITQRLNELGWSKSEFGRKIGVPQQNVNRILDKSSIDTDKLVLISKVLNYNFFDLYSSSNGNNAIVTGNGSIAVNGSNNKNVVTSTDTAILQERIKALEAIIEEKERLIKVLMDRK